MRAIIFHSLPVWITKKCSVHFQGTEKWNKVNRRQWVKLLKVIAWLLTVTVLRRGEREREREITLGSLCFCFFFLFSAPLHSEICICVSVCVFDYVRIYYCVCVPVFVRSLGVLTCAGQRPYREPFVEKSSLQQGRSLPQSLSPPSIGTSLSMSVKHSFHVCLSLFFYNIEDTQWHNAFLAPYRNHHI